MSLFKRKLKLDIQLIPNTSWGDNVRSRILNWVDISNYIRRSGKCSICKTRPDREYKLHAHEMWNYNDITHEQLLEDIICVCDDCHNAIHMGRAHIIGKGKEAEEYYRKINKLTKEQAHINMNKALNQWFERSKYNWHIDNNQIKNKVKELTGITCIFYDEYLTSYINKNYNEELTSTNTNFSKAFSILDCETNCKDEVMSIGLIIVDETNYKIIDKYYGILEPACFSGGMFSGAIILENITNLISIQKGKQDIIQDILNLFSKYNIISIFGYNSSFDKNHIPELSKYNWYDIMKIAAYKQYNPALNSLECCGTGRLKKGYGVEDMYKLLSNNYNYRETHNGLIDSFDELRIMKMLNLPIDIYYKNAQVINKK